MNYLLLAKRASAALAFFVFSPLAAAGDAFLTYGPVSSVPVPVMSDGMLVLIALLMGAVAFRLLRGQRGNARGAMAGMVGAIAISGGAGGVILSSDASSAATYSVFAPISLNVRDGEEFRTLERGQSQLNNTTDLPQGILELDPFTGCSFESLGSSADAPDASGQRCLDDPMTVLQPGESCDVNLQCPNVSG